MTHPDGGRRWKVDVDDFLAVAHAVAATTPVDEALARMVKVARRGLGATGVVVVQAHPGGFHEVRAKDVAAGFQPRLRALFHRYRVSLERSLERQESFRTGPGDDAVLVTPLQGRAEQHYVVVWFSDRDWTPDAAEQALLDALASHAGGVLERAWANDEQVCSAVRAERDRLARELHDVVIQRVFASGLQLKALARNDDLEAVRVGMDAVTAGLDQVLGDIRSAIFELAEGPDCAPSDGVRDLVAEYSRTLGFRPLLSMAGEVDRVESVVGSHLLASMRELLSNVARHSGATGCRVDVRLEDGQLTLLVGDNGRGLDPDVRRSGLENVRLRASLLGGTLQVGPNEPSGTLARWRVPLPLAPALPEAPPSLLYPTE